MQSVSCIVQGDLRPEENGNVLRNLSLLGHLSDCLVDPKLPKELQADVVLTSSACSLNSPLSLVLSHLIGKTELVFSD